jgi:hypothetical protein
MLTVKTSSLVNSQVTVGYPGLEARAFGGKDALICHLVEEFGICEMLKNTKPDSIEFRDITVRQRLYPPGGSARESWPTLFYANPTSSFIGIPWLDMPSQSDRCCEGSRSYQYFAHDGPAKSCPSLSSLFHYLLIPALGVGMDQKRPVQGMGMLTESAKHTDLSQSDNIASEY